MPPEFDVAEYVALASQLSDEELEHGIAERREELLEAIFSRMADYFDPEAAAGIDAVVQWKVLGRSGGGADEYFMVIHDGRCETHSGTHEQPTVTISLGPVPFVRIVTGKENPIRLFTFGKLSVQGNLVLAARVSRFFKIPTSP